MSNSALSASPYLFGRVGRLILVSIVLAAVGLLLIFNGGSANAVTGGKVSKTGKWAVRVYEDADPICTGALIAPQWVLTAGHCVRFDNSNITFRIGNLDQRKGTKIARIPGQTYFDKKADLALVKIPAVTGAPTIALPKSGSHLDRTLTPGTILTAFGWGATCEPDETKCQSNDLRTATISVISHKNSRCDYLAGASDYCVAKKTGLPVGGDSGGPAVVFDRQHKPVLVGILAASDRTSTAAYGNLHEARAWISSITR